MSRRWTIAGAVVTFLGCMAPSGSVGRAPEEKLAALENNGRVVSDAAFTDVEALSSGDVQAFFERTPYGTRSFLANEQTSAGSVPEALVSVSQQYGINPLVLLVTLQKEASLVSARTRPSPELVDFAFGCGCPDAKACAERYRGLEKQLECAARTLSRAFDAGTSLAQTAAGYEIGHALATLDHVKVIPQNRASLSLYNYTPWVRAARLFRAIWERYSVHAGYDGGLEFPFNEGFIGGRCGSSADCLYENASCEGERCTLDCDRLCSDQPGVGWAPTFCIETAEGGRCVAQCAGDLSPTGCGYGDECIAASRYSEPEVRRDVCVR